MRSRLQIPRLPLPSFERLTAIAAAEARILEAVADLPPDDRITAVEQVLTMLERDSNR